MIGKIAQTRNAIASDFAAALAEDFAAHGKSSIEKLREKDPGAYLRLVAAMEPKTNDTGPQAAFSELSDEEIALYLEALRDLLRD